MFEVKNVDILLSTRFLIKSLTFTLNKGDKLAIIGEEGNGKSTLLKSLLGICEYAIRTGSVNFKNHTVGYLEQSMDDQNKKVYDYLFSSDYDYYNKVNTFYKYLDLFHLKEEVLEQTLHDLSGGEKVKIGILKLLINEYDILFLDEPTNDLDIQTLEWLEDFILNTSKPVMYVSHDETFLSNTANMILHLEQVMKKTDCRHTLVRMDYDSYIDFRLRKMDKQTQVAKSEKREFDKQQEKLKRIMQKVEYQQKNISRKDPHGAKVLKKKMHSLKSQEKRLYSTQLTEIPDIEEGIDFFFENVGIPKTKEIVSLHIPELKIQGKILSKNIHLDIVGNTHLCIVGKNGSGKSTLIKLIYHQLKNREDIKVGYMPQDYGEILNQYESVLDFVSLSSDKEEITKARMYLGNMKFTKEEMTSKIEELSNGTKAKLFLVKFVLDECNVLLLDEPTRNISPLSNPVLRRVLKRFKGTIISVSHDRKFIDEVINEVYVLEEKQLLKI